jgi:hypothetical protein
MMRWSAMFVFVLACSDAPQLKPIEHSRVPLGQRLANEAAARPAQAVRPQQLIDALQQQGVVIARSKQVLASPIEASYCELAATERGLALSICEFGDEELAARGRAKSRDTFDAMIPGRTLDLRGNALLTITRPASPEAERESELARTTFAALPPTAR